MTLKLGIVANEFFDPVIGRMGGFGWAARQVATCFNEDPALGVEAVFLTGELPATSEKHEILVHGTRLILRQPRRLDHFRRVRSEHIDLLLTIDYRPSYRFAFWTLPRTPIIVWVHDPRPPEDVAKVNTLRIPGTEHAYPGGIHPIDCSSLSPFVRYSQWLHRPLFFSTPAPHLASKVCGTYGIHMPELSFLPNILELPVGKIVKSQRPRIVFLGRLDPIKRPWLFVELGRMFPEVEFLVLGALQVRGAAVWHPAALPENVRIMGHLDGNEKYSLLSSAWALVNTSIHEALAISFLEALLCETPILSCQDPEQLVSRFGIYIGRWDGTGLDGLPRFAEGLNQLLRDGPMRVRLGAAGRKWVEENHSRTRFLEAFQDLCVKAGVHQGARSGSGRVGRSHLSP
jgi:glycosyltransferase involved in cell wall biosynthesis